MRGMPHMYVADPGDNGELRSVMRTAVLTEGPVCFRIARWTMPRLFAQDHPFAWGKGHSLSEGSDVAIG